MAFVGICLPRSLFLLSCLTLFSTVLTLATTIHPLTVGIYVFPHRIHLCIIWVCICILCACACNMHMGSGLPLKRWHRNQKLYNWKERRFLLRVLRNGLNKTYKRVVLLKFIVETTLSYEPRGGVSAGGGVLCKRNKWIHLLFKA